MKTLRSDGLTDETHEKLNAIFRAYPQIETVWLYGSRALGTFRPSSDIDLCIESHSLSLNELFSIENQIDDLLLPWKVDLSLKSKIENEALLHHIQDHGEPFYLNVV